MPRKVRELIRDLEKMGFLNRGGKGSHQNYKHPVGIKITISGHPGDDAKPYQEKALKIAIKEVCDAKK
ncbi:MAG: type II toxin-antitoxin system HicA family toxin [Nitrospirota bacterium]